MKQPRHSVEIFFKISFVCTTKYAAGGNIFEGRNRPVSSLLGGAKNLFDYWNLQFINRVPKCDVTKILFLAIVILALNSEKAA